MKMKKSRKIINISLICFLLMTSYVTWQTWGGTKEKKAEENFYTVTLDGNGETISLSPEGEERLLEKNIEIIATSSLQSLRNSNTATSSDALDDEDIASVSDAEKDVDLASGSNSRMRKLSDKTFQTLQLKVPAGTDVSSFLEEFTTYAFGWSTVKNDVTTNVSYDSMYGGIGVTKPLTIASDTTLYALGFKEVMYHKDESKETWGYKVRANATINSSDTMTGSVTPPSMNQDEMAQALLSVNVEDFDYDKSFQIDFTGFDADKVGIFLNIIGDYSLPMNIYRLDNSGKTILEEVTYVFSEYGDDEGRTGNNAAFMIDREGSYLVIPSMRLLNVYVENVKGGFVMVNAYIPNMDGQTTEAWLPIGEISAVPMGTELDLYDINNMNYWFLGMTDTELDKYEEELEYTTLKHYILKNKDGNESILPAERPYYVVSEDVSIKAVFEKDLDDGPASPGDPAERILVKITDNSYQETEKVDSEISVCVGKSEEVQVQNLSLCIDDPDNDSFYLENGRLKSYDVLPCGRYTVSFEFDYEGTHYSGYGSDRTFGLHRSVTVGNAADFYSPAMKGSFNGNEYYIDATHSSIDTIYASAGTEFKDLESNIDRSELPVLLNYSFERWYGTDGNPISENKKLGNGIIAIGNYVNSEGKGYNPVIHPLEGAAEDETPPTDESTSDSESGESTGTSSYEMPGQWIQSQNGWRFKKSNGSYAKNEWGMVNGSWYYFGENTYMSTNWILWNGDWYFLEPTSGGMQTGWLLTDGKWYYLNPLSDGTKGKMVKNQWVGSNYVGENGIWVEQAVK